MRRRGSRYVLSALLALAGLSTLTGAFGIDKEEFDCEQAVAHLSDCCPAFDARSIVCSNGCDYPSGPELHSAGAECIIGATCEDLVSSGACDSPRKVTCR